MTTQSWHHRFLARTDLDYLLLGSPLRRPRVARVVVAMLLGTLAVASLALLGMLAGLRADILHVFVWGLGASSVGAIVPVAIIVFLDRRERESPWLYAIALLWGAVIATGLALPINTGILHAVADWVHSHPEVARALGPQAPMLIVVPIAGPVVEELTKGLGVLALFLLLHAEFDNMRDGFVYGALIGVGFTWIEAPLHAAQGYARLGVAPWGIEFGVRYALFGLAGHAMFTGIFGAFVGLARQTGRKWLRYAAPVIGLTLAIAAHTVNNAMALLAVAASSTAASAAAGAPVEPTDLTLVQVWFHASALQLVVFFPFFALLLFLLWRSGKWERRVIREELAEEVGVCVSPEEYAQIQRDRIFRTRRIAGLRRARSAALVNAQHELAFRKRRVRDRNAHPDTDPLVAAWRQEIARLRALGPD